MWWKRLENFFHINLKKSLFILLFLNGVAKATPRFDKELNKDELPLSLERHKRLYFVSGKENTKLQVSFKIPLILNKKLYLGYTQTDFWNLFQKSSNPFQDINHNPELFYRWNTDDASIVDLGIEHVSNGRDKEHSRSWNALYVNSVKRWDKNYYASGKTYALFDVDGTNEDIKKYIGFFELEAGVTDVIRSKFQSNELFFRWRPGSNLAFNDRLDTLEFGLKVKFSKYRMFQHFYISYYNGYAENLLEYNRYIRALRVGLIF